MMITEGLLQSKLLTQCFRTKTTLSLLCTWVLCWFVFALVTCFGWVDQPKHSMKVHKLYENLAFQPLNIPHIPRVSQWVCQWLKTDFPLRAPCNPSVARSPINHQGYCVRSIWHAIPYMVPTFDQSPMGVRVPFGIQKMTSPFNQSPPLEPSATLTVSPSHIPLSEPSSIWYCTGGALCATQRQAGIYKHAYCWNAGIHTPVLIAVLRPVRQSWWAWGAASQVYCCCCPNPQNSPRLTGHRSCNMRAHSTGYYYWLAMTRLSNPQVNHCLGTTLHGSLKTLQASHNPTHSTLTTQQTNHLWKECSSTHLL